MKAASSAVQKLNIVVYIKGGILQALALRTDAAAALNLAQEWADIDGLVLRNEGATGGPWMSEDEDADLYILNDIETDGVPY